MPEKFGQVSTAVRCGFFVENDLHSYVNNKFNNVRSKPDLKMSVKTKLELKSLMAVLVFFRTYCGLN